jgi:putative oxidoreductase
MKIFQKITKPIITNWLLDITIAIPRIVYGYFLTAEFGSPKFGLPWTDPDKNLQLFEVVFWFPQDVAEYGGIFGAFPRFFAWMAAFAEGVGGVAWIIGFQTRIFSFLILCTMIVIVFIHQMKFGLWNMMPGMGIMWIAFITLAIGSGRWGIDYFISKINTNE